MARTYHFEKTPHKELLRPGRSVSEVTENKGSSFTIENSFEISKKPLMFPRKLKFAKMELSLLS